MEGMHACVCASANECEGVYLVIVLATKMLQYTLMINMLNLNSKIYVQRLLSLLL